MLSSHVKTVLDPDVYDEGVCWPGARSCLHFSSRPNTSLIVALNSSSGTYGRVYKAASKTGNDHSKLYAIKKFKPDKEGDVLTYTGISQSAIREIALNREISHVNVVALKEVILEEKSIYMIFEYAEHDFLVSESAHSLDAHRLKVRIRVSV